MGVKKSLALAANEPRSKPSKNFFFDGLSQFTATAHHYLLSLNQQVIAWQPITSLYVVKRFKKAHIF